MESSNQVELTEVEPSEYADIPRCVYCGKVIQEKVVQIDTSIPYQDLRIHRNCVVAFATRILNEFEKL
jgi:hypothetical protein